MLEDAFSCACMHQILYLYERELYRPKQRRSRQRCVRYMALGTLSRKVNRSCTLGPANPRCGGAGKEDFGRFPGVLPVGDPFWTCLGCLLLVYFLFRLPCAWATGSIFSIFAALVSNTQSRFTPARAEQDEAVFFSIDLRPLSCTYFFRNQVSCPPLFVCKGVYIEMQMYRGYQ